MTGARVLRAAKAAVALAVLAGGVVAGAEPAGHVYSYADKWFSIQFPADPAVSSGSYEAVTPAGTRTRVPATIYTLKQDDAFYQVTVADLAGTPAETPHALDHAVAAFRKRDDLALDTAVSHSLGASRYQLCGRHFGYAGADGRLNYETLYYNPNTRLFYTILSSVSPEGQGEHGAEVVHFQQSLALLPDPAAKLPAPPAYPENWKLHSYRDSGFDIRFPAEPTVEQGSYVTVGGVTVPATRYWVRQGDTLYRLTVGHLWDTEAGSADPESEDAVDQAVRVWKQQGRVEADDAVAISNGQCGRDVTVRTPEGGLARATIFFPATQHRLFIVEVAEGKAGASADPEDGRRFRESLALARAE